MNSGKIFENDFKNSFPNNIFIYRLRDNGSTFNKQNNNLRFNVTNMCDYIAFYCGSLYLLELKSTKLKSLPLNNIKPHQISDMLKYSNFNDVYAYIIINFSVLNETYAIKIKKIDTYIKTTTKKSIPLQWCRDNGVKIEQELKKTHYKYNIKNFFKKML